MADAEGVVSALREIDGGVEVLEHENVLTVDACEKALAGKEGLAIAKNLLLKDKNGKLIHIVALNSTEIDMKMLSLRLGLGKKHPRMAPEEALSKIFQVPAGCLTPLALSRPDTKNVVVLLDQKLKTEARVLFHPLRNDRSVVMSMDVLDKYLSQFCGRKGTYVDFEKKDVKFGKDNPPDLKPLLDAVKAYEFVPEAAGSAAAPQKQSKSSSKKGKGKKKEEPKGKKEGAGDLAVDDVHALLAEIQGTLMKGVALDERTYKDLESRLNAFKNVSYTRGYTAAKAEIISYIKA
ncbi:hypothetical protein A3770_02p18880 [Chloropicon primus]|uniref:YbaK/aminoacyl-tRNA synthetase-associated domain-containing protein n=1 Tax=Chloropicon primus TaxID=1764295 RepID=A0A5B8MJ05_9CHLO|nr:hypothetical protein A3770_02p18880 [Chloropicon primus]|eukprot:QDZ19370.1 hypothetical protein A3770_02p18880 [Chloropicon primus]